MTRREKMWTLRKMAVRKYRQAVLRMRCELSYSFMMIGAAGSRVWKDDDGKVRVKILSPEECLELLEKKRRGEPILDEYTLLDDGVESNIKGVTW